MKVKYKIYLFLIKKKNMNTFKTVGIKTCISRLTSVVPISRVVLLPYLY